MGEWRGTTEWVEIAGASPQIVDDALWQRAQEIIQDPERARRAPTPARTYELRGRMKCGVCGAAMVGQTLKVKGHAHSYYRCRGAYDRRHGTDCETRYVRAIDLEQAIWREVTAVLSSPRTVLEELERGRDREEGPSQVEERGRIEREIAGLREREKRLVRLYTFGEIDDATVREEGANLRRQRQVLEERLASLKRPERPGPGRVDASLLEQACALVARWLEGAGTEERMLALEALQVAVTTTRESASLTGVLPVEPPPFITDEQSCRCTLPGDKSAAASGVPFRATITLP